MRAPGLPGAGHPPSFKKKKLTSDADHGPVVSLGDGLHVLVAPVRKRLGPDGDAYCALQGRVVPTAQGVPQIHFVLPEQARFHLAIRIRMKN